MYLLGYDIGSSSIKTALIHASSKSVIDIVRFPKEEMEIISHHEGWAEQEPETWWKYVCEGTRTIIQKNKISPTDIEAIGISYQMHGLVLIDQNHHLLRPAIIWCDSRAVDLGHKAFTTIGETYCLENFLNSPGNFTASKLAWVKENEPALYKRAKYFLLPGDYIAMKLTGNPSTTISGLSEGILWNFKQNRIGNEILDNYNIRRDLIPEYHTSFSAIGTVSQQAADETGLAAGTTLSYRAGDQPNNALTLNVLEPGEIAATCGTSGVVYGIVDKPIYDQKSRVNAFAHVNHSKDHNRIGILLCINGAGSQYNWIRNHVAEPNIHYDEIEKRMRDIPIGADSINIYPYGNGAERIFENKNLGSQIQGLHFNRHTRPHLYRAAVEGVAFTFVYGIEILKEIGLDVASLKVGNDNLFKSAVFSKTIASLLNVKIEVMDTTGAVGAALGAGYGIGYYDNISDAVSNIRTIRTWQPEKNEEYKRAYNRWKDGLSKMISSIKVK